MEPNRIAADDWENVEGGGQQYPFLNGMAREQRTRLIGLIESEQYEEVESLMGYASIGNQETFRQWKTSQLNVRYPFLSGLNEETRKRVLNHIQNGNMAHADVLMEATANQSQYNNWKKDQEKHSFLKRYPFLVGIDENARNIIVMHIETNDLEKAKLVIECFPENLQAFESWKQQKQTINTLPEHQPNDQYPFLNGESEQAKKTMIDHINNGRWKKAEEFTTVLSANNREKYQNWILTKEKEDYPFLEGATPNAQSAIKTAIEAKDMALADNLSSALSREMQAKYHEWKTKHQNEKPINSLPEHQPNDQYPFLNGESDQVQKTMLDHINNGRWKEAEKFTAVFSDNNQKLYQQWRLTIGQEDYPFLNGATPNARSSIKIAIEANDMALADILSSALSPEMQAKYYEWKTNQFGNPEVPNTENELPFLVGEDPVLKQLITAEYAKGEIGKGFIDVLKPDNQMRYAEWKSEQISSVNYDFLIGADKQTIRIITAAIETNDLVYARHLSDLLSTEKQSEMQNWLNERALGLLFLDGEPDHLKNAMRRKMEINDLVGMEALSRLLSTQNQNLFRNWHDNEKSGLSFLNGIPDDLVMANMREFCVRRKFADAEVLLESIPEANRNGYYAWKNSLEDGAPANTTFRTVDENREEANPVPIAGDTNSFFQQNLPIDTNILILGETGVGKSTFINALVNYVEHKSLEDAERNGPTVLIPASFSMNLSNDYRDSTRINLDPTVGDISRLKKNENVEQGQSSTQGAKEYKFKFTNANQTRTLHIIDTPGIGDCRGVEQDNKNLDNILNFIANYKELHAICILLKPNQPRLNVVFKFCIDQLLMHLHRSAADSIVFCFTSTRGTYFSAGDTYATLQTHLQKLHGPNGTRIDLSENTLYFFDNEGFRYLCAKKQGHSFNPEETAEYKTSYAHSLKEVKRLIANIALRRTHQVIDTISVNSTRQLLLTMMKPIGEISQQQMKDLRELDEKKKEIEQLARAGADLTGKLNYNTVELFAVELTKPQTVCTSANCVDYQRIDERSQQMETIYITVCHKDCHLVGVAAENCPNEDLKNCWAMGPSGEVCRICACSWSVHMHIRYRIEKRPKTVVDTNVQQSIEMNENREKTAQIFINNLETKRAEIDKELDFMRHCCVEFASFLKKNSILSYNDSYGEYVKYLIRTEDQKVQNGADRTLLDQLLEHQRLYEEEVKLIEQEGKGVISNNEDLRAMVEKLHTLKHCGAQLAQLHEMETKTSEKSTQNDASNVTVKMP